MPLRTLIVVPTAERAGSERAAHALAVGLRSLGIDIDLLVLQDGPLVRWLTADAFPVSVGAGASFRKPYGLYRSMKAVRTLLRLRPDIVIGSGTKAALVARFALGFGRHRPLLIWWQHGWADGSRQERLLARLRPAAVVAVSEAAAERQGSTHRSLRVSRIYPSSLLATIPAGARQPFEERDTHVLVGVIGRIQPWKGQLDFIRAAELAAQRTGNVRIFVIGGVLDPADRLYEREVDQRLTDFPGAVRIPHVSDPTELMNKLDVVVVPSRNEPFGLVVVEAMALGKAVVAYREGGPAEIIHHDRNGLLVAPGDVSALALAMERLILDPQLRTRLGDNARRRAMEFSPAVTAEGFRRLFKELVS